MANKKASVYNFKIGHPDYNDFTEFDNNLYINSVGYLHAASSENITCRPNGRDDYHILYIKGGSFHLKIRETEYTLSQGDIAFISYNTPHEYHNISKDIIDYYWLHFKGESIQLLLNDLNLSDSGIFHINDTGKICAIFENIIDELNSQKYMYLKRCHILLTTLLLELHQQLVLSNNTFQKQRNQIESIRSMMRSQNCLNMTVDDFAKMSHLSKSRFIKAFKSATGYTPIEYRNICVIENAKWHLRNTSMTISEISNVLGFFNSSYFSTLFKKQEKLSPLQYREKYKNE